MCWCNRDVNFMFSRGKERYTLRDSEIRDVAAKMSFSVDHGFSAFENGWVGSEDMFKTRSRRTERPLKQRSSLISSTDFTTHTRYTLKAHSLVCIKWSHRSRKRPFKRVHLSSKKDPGLRCALGWNPAPNSKEGGRKGSVARGEDSSELR